MDNVKTKETFIYEYLMSMCLTGIIFILFGKPTSKSEIIYIQYSHLHSYVFTYIRSEYHER